MATSATTEEHKMSPRSERSISPERQPLEHASRQGTDVSGISDSDDAWDCKNKRSVGSNGDENHSDRIVFTKAAITLRPSDDDKNTLTIDKGSRVKIMQTLQCGAFLIFSQEHKRFGICFSELLEIPEAIIKELNNDDLYEIERRRVEDTDMVCNDIGEVPKSVESTPLVSVPHKRKSLDSTIVRPPRARRRATRLHYRSLNKHVKETKKKIHMLNQTLSDIAEVLEEARDSGAPVEKEVDPKNPFLKCLDTGNLSTIPPVSSDDELDSELDVPLEKTYLPPSTFYFSNDQKRYDSTKTDRETENALKFVRSHPERIPRYKDHTLPLALFLCRIVYNFAVQYGLQDVSSLSRWIYHCFPNNNQEKVIYFLDLVRLKFPKAGIFTTLRELARRLSPDDFMSLQNLQPRGAEEGLTDLVIRLLSDIPIVLDCTQSEIPNLVSQFVKNSEQNSAIGTEFRRELIRNRDPLSRDSLIKMACRVDRLIKPSPREAIASFTQPQVAICSVCHGEHTHCRDDGRAWPACEECFYAFAYDKQKVYNAPRQPATEPRSNVTRCVDCDVKTAVNPRTRRPYLRCQDCFDRNRPKFDKFRSTQRRPFQARRAPQGNNTFPNARRTNSYARRDNNHRVNEFKSRAWFNPKCYRMATKVQNSERTAAVTGLIDTGCNTEVISRKACRELGITKDIQPRNSYASVVDGEKLLIVGSVLASVYVGDVKYTGEFSVIDHIEDYDMMVGTSFMKQSGLLNDIFEAAKNRLGESNVRKGN